MPLWLAPQPLVLASRSEVRGKMLAACRPALRDAAGADRRARGGGARPAAAMPPAARALAGARQGAEPWRRRCPAGWCWARIRRWRAGMNASASRQDRAEAAAQLRSNCAGRRHALHSALALVRDGEVLFDLRRHRAADHARFLRRVSRRLSRHGGRRGAGQRRRLSARRHRRAFVRAGGGRLFHHSRPAAAAAAWIFCGRTGFVAG